MPRKIVTDFYLFLILELKSGKISYNFPMHEIKSGKRIANFHAIFKNEKKKDDFFFVDKKSQNINKMQGNQNVKKH